MNEEEPIRDAASSHDIEADAGSSMASDSYPDEDAFLLSASEPRRAWIGTNDLDLFFSRLYMYWEEKGLVAIATARCLNLAALAFAGLISGIILLGIDYGAFHDPCLQGGTCNLWEVAKIRHPFSGPFSLFKGLSVLYLVSLLSFWFFALIHMILEIRSLLEVRCYYHRHLGLTDRTLRYATWPEVAARIVSSQRTIRLCNSRELDESDIAARIMRRDNYMIALLHNGILALQSPLVPGMKSNRTLTKTLEWNLKFCLFDPLFDEQFRINRHLLGNPTALRRRFRIAAVVNAAFAPFLLIFLLTYFFLKNAEEIYHHPSSITARRWSSLARWHLREFNELPCFLNHRLNAGHAAATKYMQQFPNFTLSHIAQFVAFVAGSLMAGLLLLTVVDEHVLEWDLVSGRQTVWWLAVLGLILAAVRPAIIEDSLAVFEPDVALLEVSVLTHHFPNHWRGRGHSLEVLNEFEGLFQYRAYIFLQEFASIIFTPIMLWNQFPKCVSDAIQFIKQQTCHVDGVGDVCSFSVFDARYLNQRQSPSDLDTGGHTENTEGIMDDKMKKSLISFAAAYPLWRLPGQTHAFVQEHVELGTAIDILQSFSTAEKLSSNIPSHLEARFDSNRKDRKSTMDVQERLQKTSTFSVLASRYPGLAKYMQEALLPTKEPHGNFPNYLMNGNRNSSINEQTLGNRNRLFASAEMLPQSRGVGGGLENPGDRVVLSYVLWRSFCELEDTGLYSKKSNVGCDDADFRNTAPMENGGATDHDQLYRSAKSARGKTFSVPLDWNRGSASDQNLSSELISFKNRSSDST